MDMGCKSSQPSREIGLPPRPSTARPRTTRPPTATRPQSSQRGPSRSARPRSQARPPGSSSGSRTGTSHDRRERDRPRTGARLPTVDERQPPTDDEIMHDISTLDTFIDQHSQNFYRPQDASSVRREVGRQLISRLIENREDGTIVNPLRFPPLAFPHYQGLISQGTVAAVVADRCVVWVRAG